MANQEDNLDNKEIINVASATLRSPTFWPQKVALWFQQLEAQFVIGRITKDETRFGYLIAQLDGKYAVEVEDIICNPPEINKYETLKAELIKRLSDSDTMRIRKLLETEEIGDRTPTQFWRHLKDLAGSAVNEEFLVKIWKNRLPTNTQLVLAATSDKVGSKLAEIADRVHEIPAARHRIASTSASTTSTTSSQEIQLLRESLEQVQLQLKALTDERRSRKPWRRFKSRERSGSKNRQRSNSVPRNLCWYHHNYAEKAAKCIPPCSWSGPKPGNL
ncbi:uncharacterized protein LOC105663238 [Megachile rotundata]|uniref:uncharacterized protein LOC105663238 n=1 Tax=Megachile rotundata TaxID=143995 RepID=UPI003FD49136